MRIVVVGRLGIAFFGRLAKMAMSLVVRKRGFFV